MRTNSTARRSAFVTTHWSVVISARDAASAQSDAALEKLCRAYWYPLYAFARWRGYAAEDAEDLTQEFFFRLLQKRYLASAQPERGRFRTFLLMAFKRFLANEWDRARAQKRGGNAAPMPFDTALAERLYQSEPAKELPAEKKYDQRWALSLIEQTMSRLRAEFEAAGKRDEFERLKGFLAAGSAELPPAAAAAEDGARRVAVHRLRKRFRQIFREEIASTVADAAEVDGEVRHLLAVLSE